MTSPQRRLPDLNQAAEYLLRAVGDYLDRQAEIDEAHFQKWQQDTVMPDVVARWVQECCA